MAKSEEFLCRKVHKNDVVNFGNETIFNKDFLSLYNEAFSMPQNIRQYLG